MLDKRTDYDEQQADEEEVKEEEMRFLRKSLFPLLGVLSLLSSPANATNWDLSTIGGLRNMCSGTEGVADGQAELRDLVCIGYLAGLMSAMNYYSTVLGMKAICIPAGVDVRQATGIFMKWANDHPESWHRPSVNGVFEAFGEHYRCKR